jgi:hypothetical protein
LGLKTISYTFVTYSTGLKSLISILLCATFILQPVSKFVIVINYELNKISIAQNFCENKAKPKMQCNGKCYLKKQLEKEEKKQEPLPGSLKEKSEVQFHSIAVISELKITSTECVPYFIYSFSLPDAPAFSVFHPPTV